MSSSTWVSVLAVLAMAASTALAIPAFPGAEGVGANATGGRYGDVYHVTSLADTNTPGTLRYGITSASDTRTIVFDISGTIWITGDLRFNKSDITVAGQTAPGDGIMIASNGVGIVNCQNVIFRHVAIRLGDQRQVDRDAFGTANVNTAIIDHVSVSWGVDETLSASNSDQVTVQWSIVSEGLKNSYHSEEPNVYQAHSMGSLLRYGTGQFTFHHNLYAHNNSRNPRIGDNLDLDWVNNVVYDGGTSSSGAASEGTPQVNYVGNYIVRGNGGPNGLFASGSSNTQIYQSDNLYDGDRDHVRDGTDPSWGGISGSYTPVATRFPLPATVTESAQVAYERVLNEAGSSLRRDAADTRIVNDVRNETGSVIDSQTQVGGYPTYAEANRAADFDTDGDGMPNTWELAHGLNPNTPDHNGDYDADGYLNLEEYLNELAPIPAPKAIVWTGGTAGRYELITNWGIPWQPTLADRTEINSGKATVGYRFQEAGTLVVGNTAAGNAELAVTTGQLSVADALYVGSAAGARGTANLTGGSLTAGGAVILASSSASTGELKVAKGAYVQVGGLTVNEGDDRSSRVAVELASDGHTLIHTTAASTLGGVLDVQSLSGFRPREGDTFAIISSTDPNGLHFAGDFGEITSNITRGLPVGSPALEGSANGADYELRFLGYTHGDINGDHKVNGGDLALMGGNWMLTGQGWSEGDFGGDAKVNGDDVALMSGNWMWTLPGGPGQATADGGEAPTGDDWTSWSPPPSAVDVSIPEPATLVLLALLGPGVIRKRTRVR